MANDTQTGQLPQRVDAFDLVALAGVEDIAQSTSGVAAPLKEHGLTEWPVRAEDDVGARRDGQH